MGEQRVHEEIDHRARVARQLLRDLHALERMIADGMIESGVRRIGAEQELVLVDRAWRPAPVAMEVLDELDDPRFTTEIARFNLEINLEPLTLEGDCFSRLQRRLEQRLGRVREAMGRRDGEAILCGILPTLRKTDLGLDNLSPQPRYAALNDALTQLRGGPYRFHLKGVDQLYFKHESIMVEACCTSFQAHLQVAAEEFAHLYNLAQVVTAPVLAVASNSPLLFGRRLWRETRIPVFQQSLDTRQASFHLRERYPRVSFGHEWVDESVVELFQDAIARFPVLIGPDSPQDPFRALERGEVPSLDALQVHNGTTYRWNRPCYGVYDGAPHLRIEARALPAGPTIADEVANAAFFFGLLLGSAQRCDDVRERIDFADARANFFAAAELGLDTQFTWLDGDVHPADVLIVDQLVPVARSGLESVSIDPADVDRYLEIIEQRARSRRTGAHWVLRSITDMDPAGNREAVLTAVSAGTARRQWSGQPVHEWSHVTLREGWTMRPADLRVEEFMTTDVITVDPDEPLQVAAHLMDWRRIRHLPVEDAEGRLIGMVSWYEVLHARNAQNDEEEYENGAGSAGDDDVRRKDSGSSVVTVRTIMAADPKTVGPETTLADALTILEELKVDSLPVVEEDRLVGLVTEHDFLKVVGRLLQQASE